MQGAFSLDAAMQLSERYNAIFSKQQCNPDPQNTGWVKGRNLGPNGQTKSTKKGKPRQSGSSGASTSANNYQKPKFSGKCLIFQKLGHKAADYWQ